MAVQKTMVAALLLVALLAVQTAAQTSFVTDGKGVVVNDDGSLEVLAGGEVVYTSAPGLFGDVGSLKGPTPAPLPDFESLIPSLPPKEADPSASIQEALGVLTGRKML